MGVIQGLIAVDTAGKATSGIWVYREGANAVAYLEVSRVNASNFGQNGITLARNTGAGYIRNVVITDTFTFSNPGWLCSVLGLGGLHQMHSCTYTWMC